MSGKREGGEVSGTRGGGEREERGKRGGGEREERGR